MRGRSCLFGCAAALLCAAAACDQNRLARSTDAAVPSDEDTGDAELIEPLDADGAEPDAASEAPDAAESADARRMLTIHFRGKVGADDYACGATYPAQGSGAVTARGRAFRFFVHDVRLIDAAGAEIPLELEERPPAQNSSVALLDFGNVDGSCPSLGGATNDVVTGYVTDGDYRGIAFSVGVPEALNHGDPAQAPAPLRGSGMAWNWVQGYRFLVAELEAAELPDAGANTDAGVAAASADAATGDEPGLGVLHLGSTGCVGSPAKGISCAKQNRAEVVLPRFDAETDSVVADLGALFVDVDLVLGTQCHSRGEECAPMFGPLGIDLASGSASRPQTLFRVE